MMNVKDFEDYLHLSIQEAGIKLNLCPTVMKRVCRRDGLRRWPSRKVSFLSPAPHFYIALIIEVTEFSHCLGNDCRLIALRGRYRSDKRV